MAHALLEWETIDKYQIDELMQGKQIAPPAPKVETPVVEDKVQPDAEVDSKLAVLS